MHIQEEEEGEPDEEYTQYDNEDEDQLLFHEYQEEMNRNSVKRDGNLENLKFYDFLGKVGLNINMIVGGKVFVDNQTEVNVLNVKNKITATNEVGALKT